MGKRYTKKDILAAYDRTGELLRVKSELFKDDELLNCLAGLRVMFLVEQNLFTMDSEKNTVSFNSLPDDTPLGQDSADFLESLAQLLDACNNYKPIVMAAKKGLA